MQEEKKVKSILGSDTETKLANDLADVVYDVHALQDPHAYIPHTPILVSKCRLDIQSQSYHDGYGTPS